MTLQTDTETPRTQLPDRLFKVDPTRVEEFVAALGVEPRAGWSPTPGQPAPAGFLMYVTTYGARPVLDSTGFDPLRIVFGSTAVVMHRTVLIGDELTVRCALSPVRARGTGKATLRMVDVLCDYVDPDGTVAAQERTVIIERGAE
jgi:hypothetical protein